MNESRGQCAYSDRVQKPNRDLAEVDILDLGTIAGNKNGTYIWNATRIRALDTISWMRGRHSAKAGIDLNFNLRQRLREHLGGTEAR
jgi:hypothetical protein